MPSAKSASFSLQCPIVANSARIKRRMSALPAPYARLDFLVHSKHNFSSRRHTKAKDKDAYQTAPSAPSIAGLSRSDKPTGLDGGERRSVPDCRRPSLRSFLLFDVLFDDRQWCATAGSNEIAATPQHLLTVAQFRRNLAA